VKSARAGTVSIGEAYLQSSGSSLMLHNSYFGNVDTCMIPHESRRVRRCLVHKEEARRWGKKCEQQGYTMVVLKIYFNDDSKIKMEVGLGKGKVRIYILRKIC
jgi:SsrA-binding protein